MKQMSSDYVRGLYFHKYGWSLGLGIGVPIPVLDEDVVKALAITDDRIFAPVLDYAVQSRARKPVKEVSYAQLRSGTIDINGKEVRTSSLSSYRKAQDITRELKMWIQEKKFLLTRPVETFPAEQVQKTLEINSRTEA
jgi:uncharacterized protein (DUF39 family)